MTLQPNALYFGDCLDWMQRWDDQSVDLIYLDPPFNSNTNYNILYSTAGGGQAQVRAFDDTWHWDTAAAERYAMYEAGRRTASTPRYCRPVADTWREWDAGLLDLHGRTARALSPAPQANRQPVSPL